MTMKTFFNILDAIFCVCCVILGIVYIVNEEILFGIMLINVGCCGYVSHYIIDKYHFEVNSLNTELDLAEQIIEKYEKREQIFNDIIANYKERLALCESNIVATDISKEKLCKLAEVNQEDIKVILLETVGDSFQITLMMKDITEDSKILSVRFDK